MTRRRSMPLAALALLCAPWAMGCDRPESVPTDGGVGASALPDFRRGLKSQDSSARSSSAQAIGRLGPLAKDAVPDLIAVLGDRDLAVRAAAAYALGQIGPDARPALPELESLKRQAPLREVAARAIEQIGR